jgi:DsbC/DsbD-like thiol-disulfide interchange protein
MLCRWQIGAQDNLQAMKVHGHSRFPAPVATERGNWMFIGYGNEPVSL